MDTVRRLAWSGLLAASAVAAPATTPQKIVEEYLNAHGGAKAIAQIRTETIAGNLKEDSTGKTGSWSLIAVTADRFYTEIIPARVANRSLVSY